MKRFGIAATFNTAAEITAAAEKVRDAGFRRWDCYTPFPVHGLHHAQGLGRSWVSKIVFIGGVTGFITGTLMAWWMGAVDYPLIVGGKPFFSPIFPFPVMYELTILFSAFGAFFGMFITSLLPRHNHAAFNAKNWSEIMDDRFLIVIESRDPQFDLEKTKAFLGEIGGNEIEEINEDD